jgi:6-phosphogluconolactonase
MTLVYIGTYTSNIFVLRLDPATGALSHIQTQEGVPKPSYLSLSHDGRTLYATNEFVDDGGVSAFAVDGATGELRFLNRVASGGADPAHVSVDPTGRWLLVANYTGGTIAVVPIKPDGALGEASHIVRHTGSGPHSTRQRGPHPHMIVSDPDGRFVLVPDLGQDAVLAYRLDIATGHLIAQPDGGGRLAAGAGPRHLAFGAAGTHAYVIDELASTLAVFAYHHGRLTQEQIVSTLPDDYTGENTTAAVVVEPSGRFVYGSNRGHDSIAAFAIDSSGGVVSLGQTPTGGRTPRDINVDPRGTFLLAANQDSDTVTTFRIDSRTGGLEPTGHTLRVEAPARVLFG